MTKQVKTLEEVAKEYPGVYLRGNAIRIEFYFQKVYCRETLKGLPATKANVRWAADKLTVIKHEIATKTFDYRKHFPESPKADIFAPLTYVPTVDEALDNWLGLKEQEIRPETHRHYVQDSDNHLRPKFGKRRLDSITQSEIKKWRLKDLGHLANKTINDVCIPLRGIYETAMADRIIDFNPMTHVKNLERETADTADPFTMDELTKFATLDTPRLGELNAFLFACFSGLRVSEWMSLAWEDVNLDKRTIKISRSVVRGKYSLPKNKGSDRTVHLLDDAYHYLVQQKEHTYLKPKQTVSVYNAKTRKTKKEKLTFVFIDSVKQEPFTDSGRASERFFDHWLKKLGIRHRGINQARHTYASQLLTQGAPERWICKEMGHTSIAMLEKHYAKWMEDEMPDMAGKLSKNYSITPNILPKINKLL